MAANALMLLGCGKAGASELVPTKPDLTAWTWYWKFDEGSGTSAANTGVGSSLGGTLYAHSGSVPSWQTDSSLGGTCLLFNSGTDRNAVRKPQYPAAWRPTTNFSIVMAVKASDLGGATEYPALYSYGDYVSGADRNGFYIILDYAGTGLNITTCDGGGTQRTSIWSHATLGIAVDTAFMLGVVKNGASMAVYINGSAKTPDTSASHVTIGYKTDEYPSAGFSSDPSVFTDPLYGFEGYIGWMAGDTSVKSAADILAVAQAAGFA